MTVADYQPFVDRMIEMYEGTSYGWDAADPGGPTKYGITCFDLAEYLDQSMNSMAAWAPKVAAMDLATAEIIYDEKYATACRFDDLVAGADCAVFDFGVNSGPSRAIKYAQWVVGTTADGILGPITLAAINGSDPVSFINDLCAERLAFLRRLGIWSTFGSGWTNRVNDLRAYCLGLASPPQPKVAAQSFSTKPQLIKNAFGKSYYPNDKGRMP